MDQPGAEEAEVVAGGGEHEVDGVAGGAGEEVASEMAVALQMAGVTPRFWPETKTRALSASWPR